MIPHQGLRLWGSGEVSSPTQNNEWQPLTGCACLFSTGDVAVRHNELGLGVLNTLGLAVRRSVPFSFPLVLNCVFTLEEIILRSSLVAPSRVRAPRRLISTTAENGSASVQGVEGLSCLSLKESEVAIMLSKQCVSVTWNQIIRVSNFLAFQVH